MAETKNEQQPHSFKRKLGNTTYTVKVHFSKNTDKTFKDRTQRLKHSCHPCGDTGKTCAGGICRTEEKAVCPGKKSMAITKSS
ncbi:MAG: transposon-encoded TnpW family protein [Lachnospiraceae bacterium]|nr:transposon-encoded TnpW family protein [Lachnospiraceae bacterium]